MARRPPSRFAAVAAGRRLRAVASCPRGREVGAVTSLSMMDRRTMTTTRMWVFTVLAAGPLVVLRGAIPTTYAVAAAPGLPLAFLVVAVVLGLLGVGYTAMARQAPHPAVFYAVIARGLGRPAGVGAG